MSSKMARWIGRVGGYQRPGNDKELCWSLWPSVWSGPLLMTIAGQIATISHLFTGFFGCFKQRGAGNGKCRCPNFTTFLVLKVNSKTSNSCKFCQMFQIPLQRYIFKVPHCFLFKTRMNMHKLPRYCLHCCFVDVREPWLCCLGILKRRDGATKARRDCGAVQIEAMWRWRAFQLRRVWETQRNGVGIFFGSCRFCNGKVIWLMLLDGLGDDFTWRRVIFTF